MFKLFTQFLSFITANLKAYILENNPVSDEILRQTFVIYTLINRIDLTLDKLINTIKIWQRDFYHGSTWSGCHFSLNIIHLSMALINKDINYLIDLICLHNSASNPQLKNLLRYQLRGDPYCSKIDTFDIWGQIIQRNVSHHFCGWISHYSENKGQTLNAFGEIKFFPSVERRTLFIPNYSLLLPEVKSTFELDNLSQSQWLEEINIYCQKLPEWRGDALKLLPEFPATFPINMEGDTGLKDNNYALMIEVPRQEEIMTKIIASIQEYIADFHQSFSQFKDAIQMAIQNRIEIIF